MNESTDIRVNVGKLSIDGIKMTKHDFIKKQMQSERMFAATTMNEVVEEIKSVKERLNDLEIFNSINVVLDKMNGSTHDDNAANVHVIFNVEEKKARKFDIKAMCGLDNSVGINLEMIEQNLFGRAAKVDINYHNNVRAIGGRSVTFIKPLEGIPRIKLAFGGWDNSFDHWWSKFMESSSGGFGEIMMKTKFGHHQCRFETMWREIVAHDKAPLNIFKENGHNMKSTLKHTFTRDTRDDNVYPESGYRVSLIQEMFTNLTRVGGLDSPLADLNLKLEAELQKSFSIHQFVIENTLSCGLIKSMTNDVTKVPIPDRYFVGGPLAMRGFELRSFGPLSPEGVPLGSNTYFQHGLHVYSPLPYLMKEGYAGLFRLHGFVTSATTSPFGVFDSSRDIHASGDIHGPGALNHQQMLQQYLSTFRCTTGIGVIFKLANTFRIEINYCVPLRVNPGDRVVAGFQFGIGILYS